jgi:hypothetical protein
VQKQARSFGVAIETNIKMAQGLPKHLLVATGVNRVSARDGDPKTTSLAVGVNGQDTGGASFTLILESLLEPRILQPATCVR